MEDEYGMRACWEIDRVSQFYCNSCSAYIVGHAYTPRNPTWMPVGSREVKCGHRDCEELKYISPLCTRCFKDIFDVHEQTEHDKYYMILRIKFTKKLPHRNAKNANKPSI